MVGVVVVFVVSSGYYYREEPSRFYSVILHLLLFTVPSLRRLELQQTAYKRREIAWPDMGAVSFCSRSCRRDGIAGKSLAAPPRRRNEALQWRSPNKQK